MPIIHGDHNLHDCIIHADLNVCMLIMMLTIISGPTLKQLNILSDIRVSDCVNIAMHGVLWCAIVFYVVLWCAMVCYVVLWCAIVCYGVLWCAMLCYGVL